MIPATLRSDRAATIAAVIVLLVALPLLLVWGDGMWFFLDEWSFLANRRLPSMDGFLADHNGHWVTLPLVAYRVNYELFGLNTYLPYQLLVVLAHLTVAGLVHLTMRRIGVRAWLATALMVGFVFYGAGWGNIIFGFQITLNGSVIAGLVQCLLAGHDGAWSRRDTVGVGVAILGLMTSAVFPALAVGVGVLVLARGRGLRIAAGHTVPPALVFILWFVTYGGAAESDPHPWRMVQFLYHMVFGALEGLGQGTVGGIILAVVLAAGGIRAGRDRTTIPAGPAFAFVAGLFTAVVVFGLLTGYSRAGADVDIEATASQGRYLHVSMALLLPIVGLGVQQLWEWRRPLVLVPLVVIAVALPDATDQIRNRPPFATGNADQVATIAHSDLIDQVPDGFEPIPFQDLRAAWLADAAAAGDIPEPSAAVTPQTQLTADASLALVIAPTADGPPCEPTEGRIARTVVPGTRIVVAGAARVFLTDGDVRSRPRTVPAGSTIDVQAGPVDVLVSGQGDTPLRACVAGSG